MKEEKQFAENEWVCEKCQQLNFMILDDYKSALCFQCSKLNQNISDMIMEYRISLPLPKAEDIRGIGKRPPL